MEKLFFMNDGSDIIVIATNDEPDMFFEPDAILLPAMGAAEAILHAADSLARHIVWTRTHDVDGRPLGGYAEHPYVLNDMFANIEDVTIENVLRWHAFTIVQAKNSF